MRSQAAAGWRRVAADPALLGTIVVLWALLALFVLFPLAQLLHRAFVDEGRFTLVPLLDSLADASHRAAFFNSLILATTVGALGTALGFLFALTAVRGGLADTPIVRCGRVVAAGLAAVAFDLDHLLLKSWLHHDLLALQCLLLWFFDHGPAETLTYFPIAISPPAYPAAIDLTRRNGLQPGRSRWRIFIPSPACRAGFCQCVPACICSPLADCPPLILAATLSGLL